MAEIKVFFVHLRRPKNSKDQRADPFYEFGSFGCTTCHSTNLLHPRNAANLDGARLAFVQGGRSGSSLVFLTPPVTVKVWKNNCEVRWVPPMMPFKYAAAPILVRNNGRSHFKLVNKLRKIQDGGRRRWKSVLPVRFAPWQSRCRRNWLWK